MPSGKSVSVETSFYVELIQNVIRDVYNGRSDLSARDCKRDLREVAKRVATRGIHFLTNDLPFLWKAVLNGLESGVFVRPRSFGAVGSSELPAFMPGILTLIFHDDGTLRLDADPYAVQELCQVCLLFYKLELPYSKEQKEKVITQFIKAEEDLRDLVLPEICLVMDEARVLIGRLFSGFDPLDIRPKHGPGSVATGEKANGKYFFKRKYESLHSVFPYYSYFTAGGSREILDRIKWYRQLEVRPYGQTKVVLVPKDSRGPRLISSEPLEFQWIQGGLGQAIVERCESHPLTKGYLNFTDQSVNQGLALDSSINGSFSTLDLKEASDRVSVDLVRELFPKEIFRALMAARSDATVLPDGRTVSLTKYAPMGSALCFPVLAIVVWALSKSIVCRATTGNDSVFVYGDDLIVPTDCHEKVVRRLPKYGLMINKDKSFSKGHFRESCGMDAYKGVQVTALKVKHLWTQSPFSGQEYAAYVALMNAMFKKGYWVTSTFLHEQLVHRFGKIPYGTSTSPYPCIELPDPSDCERLNSLQFRTRWNAHYQRNEFRVHCLRDRKSDSFIHGWRRLLKDYSERGPLDPLRVVVPRATQISRKYLPV